MTATYEPIATTTVSGSSVDTVTFSGISGSYTDLVIAANIIYSANNGDYISLRFNGDSSSNNYSVSRLQGNGSTVSAEGGSDNKIPFYSMSTSQYVPVLVNVMNYSNATTKKTCIIKLSNAGSIITNAIGIWNGTSAITSISFFFAVASISANSTFTLYGIKAE